MQPHTAIFNWIQEQYPNTEIYDGYRTKWIYLPAKILPDGVKFEGLFIGLINQDLKINQVTNEIPTTQLVSLPIADPNIFQKITQEIQKWQTQTTNT